MKIIAIESIGISYEQGLELKKFYEQNGHQFVLFTDVKEDEPTLIERMKEADVAIVSNIPINKNVLSHCPALKLLAVAFTGIDHIAIDYCKYQKIDVVNVSGYATIAVAEFAVGLMIDVYRKISEMDSTTRKNGTRGSFLGKQLKGKTIGIVGTGTIGLETARILNAFGCKIITYSRTQKQKAKEIGITYLSLDILLKQADIISLHLPLTEDTTLLISREKLTLCKPSAILINTSRGKIVDNVALADALNSNRLAGAGIDVFETEPPFANHPLLNAKNCILTPHIAFATEESFSARIDIVFDKINKWLAKQK
jgi:D-3-phosphoglycerate dehydrogenase